MVAYWIWASTRLLGDSELAVRLPAVLATMAVSALVWDSARLAFASRRVGALSAVWLNGTILFGAMGVVITPDAPLMLFWSAAVWAAIRLLRDQRPIWIYLLGVALGLGVLSKYTIVLILPGLVATSLLFPALRRWWARTHLYGAAILSLACTAPLIVWNLDNGFASFRKQAEHAQAAAMPQPWHNLGAYVSSQLGLMTPLIFLFCLWGMGWSLWMGWRQRRPDWFLLGATSLPVLLFFAQHSLGSVVQAHWAGPAYLGGLMAAVGAFAQSPRRRWLGRGFTAAPALGLGLCVLVYVQAATAALPLPIRLDALKRLGGWDELAAAVTPEMATRPGAFVFTMRHEVGGALSFYLPDHPTVFLVAGRLRPSYNSPDDIAALKGRDGLFVNRGPDDGAHLLLPYFAEIRPIRRVALHWGGREFQSYTIYECRSYGGGLFIP